MNDEIDLKPGLSDPRIRRIVERLSRNWFHADVDVSSLPYTLNKRPPEDPFSKRTPLSWLKSVVSEVDLGKLVHSKDSKHPIHLNKNEKVEEHFKKLSRGWRSFLSHKWQKNHLSMHASEKETWYFTGASESYKPYSLLMIDVDCHNSGSLNGAMAFLSYLREVYYANLYFETSTNGNGGHGYLLLHKQATKPSNLKPLLKHFQNWLHQQAENFDVELVEVKGFAPDMSWGKNKFELQNYKAGTLAKVPRGIFDRFEDLKNTTVLTVDELRELPEVEPPKSKTTQPLICLGSITGKHIREEHLSGLKPGGKYHCSAKLLLSSFELRTRSRAVVTVDDVAIFLMLGEFFSNNMNSDGSLPTNRWKKMWCELHDCGDVVRAWDHKRFKVVRDHLSSLGLINWEDATFRIGFFSSDGEYIPGKAAKWKFSDKLMQLLSEAEVIREVEQVEVVSSTLGGMEKHPFWEQYLTQFVSELNQCPVENVIVPVLVHCIPSYLYSPEDLTPFVSPISQIAA